MQEHTMADDPSQRGTQDRTRVNVEQEHERRYWSEKFGVSESELRRAVDQGAVQAADVEKHLKGGRG
jgi:hypothetical protein